MNLFNILKTLVEQNSYTANKAGVDKVGLKITNLMKDIGFNVEVHQRELIGNHLHFISPKKTGTKVLLLGHIDTVFPPDTFTQYSEDDEWVYGPGVCDMKGGLVVAMKALYNQYEQNKDIYNIDFLMVSDEESGSDDSRALTAKIAQDYDICLVFEAAGEHNEVVVGRKGIGTYTIEIEGKAAHAGNFYAQGVDANLELARKLEKLVALTNLDIGSTVNVGKITGGIGANTISPKASMLLELRYTKSSEKERILDAMQTIVNTSYIEGTKSILRGNIQRDVMEPNEQQMAFIKQLENISNTQIATEKRGGVSDANITASMGLTTIDGFGPFGDGDHTKDERALKNTFVERVALISKYFKIHQKEIKGVS
jgi:glutamate carboxypeptidase